MAWGRPGGRSSGDDLLLVVMASYPADGRRKGMGSQGKVILLRRRGKEPHKEEKSLSRRWFRCMMMRCTRYS